MKDVLSPDLCVIGAGSAGLSVAAGAAQMGAETVLVEQGRMGGDCLNTGCVPSKALLAAGKAATLGRRARDFGVGYDEPKIDFAAVHRHVHAVIAGIAPTDSVERFEGLGVMVIKGTARFSGPRELTVDEGRRIRPRRVVLATGSAPVVPPVPGLGEVPYLTNETVFDLTELPEHLAVVGGGPIGVELGQAFRHLGARVSIVEMAHLLPREDPELVEVARHRLAADGIALHEHATLHRVARDGAGVRLEFEDGSGAGHIEASHLLLATGRRPVLDGLNLDAAGIAHANGRLRIDRRLRTSNRRVFAVGDVAGGPQFTHVAGYHAGIVLKNALFRIPAKLDYTSVPSVVYTTPELAQTGLTEAQAKERGESFDVLRWRFDEIDRARTERDTEGLAKLVVGRGGRVLGCGIVGPHAGELIYPWILAVAERRRLGAIAQMIAPYPTYGEISKRVAGSHFTPKLFSARTRRIVRFLARFG